VRVTAKYVLSCNFVMMVVELPTEIV
jgi:hypothetical protein